MQQILPGIRLFQFAAPDRDSGGGKCRSQFTEVCLGTQQNRDIPRSDRTAVRQTRPAAQQFRDAIGDMGKFRIPCRLVRLRLIRIPGILFFAVQKVDLYARGDIPRRDALGKAQIVLRPVADTVGARAEQVPAYAVGHANDRLVTAKVLRHENTAPAVILRCPVRLCGQIQRRQSAAITGKHGGIRPPEGIDALLDIPDHETAIAADEAENGILHRIHILVLIDVHLVKALAVLRRDGAR